MADLPGPAPAGNNPVNTDKPITQSSINKEIEGGVGLGEPELRDVSGAEVELPKEVASAGVKVHPTTVTIPQPVQQMGIKPTGTNIPAQSATTVALPLTDDQIAHGLGQSITSSVRWLATWCVRRLKQAHIAIKSLHGKMVRVKS